MNTRLLTLEDKSGLEQQIEKAGSLCVTVTRDPETMIATADKTAEEILAAYNSGKSVFCKDDGYVLPLSNVDGKTIKFANLDLADGYSKALEFEILDSGEIEIYDTATKVGGGDIVVDPVEPDSGTGGATPDLNAAPGEQGHILNRTHYDETIVVNEPLNITWDGNTEGLEYAQAFMGYKVSNVVLTEENLLNASLLITDESGEHEPTGEMTINKPFEGAIMCGGLNGTKTEMLIIVINDVVAEQIGASAGTYFTLGNSLDTYVSSLTTTEPVEQTKTVTKKLDVKFLPDGIGYTEIVRTEGVFDGDMTGREVADMGDGSFFVKVSGAVFSTEDLIGEIVTLVDNGIEAQATIEEDHFTSFVDMGIPLVMVDAGYGSDICIAFEDCAIGPVAFTKGVWFHYLPESSDWGQRYTKTLSCLPYFETEVVHKIPEKYLDIKPDPSIVFFEITRDGDTLQGEITYRQVASALIDGKQIVLKVLSTNEDGMTSVQLYNLLAYSYAEKPTSLTFVQYAISIHNLIMLYIDGDPTLDSVYTISLNPVN